MYDINTIREWLINNLEPDELLELFDLSTADVFDLTWDSLSDSKIDWIIDKIEKELDSDESTDSV